MIKYYFRMAWVNQLKHPWLTTLIVVTFGIGIGTSMSLYSLLYMLSADPLPGTGNHVYLVELGSEPLDPSQLKVTDSTALASIANRYGASIIVGNAGFAGLETTDGKDLGQDRFRPVSQNFFKYFKVPLEAGRLWTKDEGSAGDPVAVLKESRAQDLFHTTNVIGKHFRLGGSSFVVVGTIADSWLPTPKFYDLESGAYSEPESIFIPFRSLRYLTEDSRSFITFTCESGNIPPKPSTINESQCLWTDLWVDIPTNAGKQKYLTAMHGYRKDHGLRNHAPPRLLDVNHVIQRNDVVPGSVKLYSLLSFGFLGLCVINASGVLLAKYLRRSVETGIRRALGASRRQIFLQFLIESVATSLVGAILGLVLTVAGIRLIRAIPESYTYLAGLNMQLLGLMLAIVVAAGILCGLLPASLASRGSPAEVLRKGAQ